MQIFVAVLLFWCLQFLSITLVFGEVGTAGIYYPPFIATQCYENDAGQFPSSNLFVAAGDGVWDNGAACGRQYLVKCISAPTNGTCIVGVQPIQVRVVDWFNNPRLPHLTSASKNANGTYTLILSDTAYQTIAKVYDPLPSGQLNNNINIEFSQI